MDWGVFDTTVKVIAICAIGAQIAHVMHCFLHELRRIANALESKTEGHNG